MWCSSRFGENRMLMTCTCNLESESTGRCLTNKIFVCSDQKVNKGRIFTKVRGQDIENRILTNYYFSSVFIFISYSHIM